ncbi:hypothetical protein [Elongatibacter sediminis]|uniref:Uncharacterized protein n=1 Tax=Elongatibacter sediminis TaxID=3119006 RepID=A0AAW9R5Q6_9GAMM
MYRLLFVLALLTAWSVETSANTYGSVEPMANPSVVDTTDLRSQSLEIREAFAQRLFSCGAVDDVLEALEETGGINTVNALNTSFSVVAGGFAGSTNPAYAYTVIDSGPNAATMDDIEVFTNALGFVFSQGSAFLLDADDPASFDFPANYAVLEFGRVPSLEESAALFELVGTIDDELFSSDSSGYTQFAGAYLTLQSFVPDQQFIDGYVEAADQFGVEYTPVVNNVPGLFTGGAAFPFNDWGANPGGEDYLGRIPAGSHAALEEIRAAIVAFTRRAENKAGHLKPHALARVLANQPCPR